jgi:hypothetical protein
MDLLREKLKADYPNLPPEVVKQLLSDPALMQRLKEEAAKQKGSGKPPTLPPDIGKMLKDLPPGEFGKNGPPGEFGKNGPPTVPKGPGQPFDPNTKARPAPELRPPPIPNDPDGKGRPSIQPKLDMPPVGKGQPPEPPAVPGGPPPQGEPFKAPDPFKDFGETPEQAAKKKAAEALAATWERNVGPIDETPAVKRALFDLIEGTADLKDPEGNSFWDSLTKDTGDGKSFADFFDGVSADGNWKWPSLDLPSLNWGRSDSNLGGGLGSSSGSGGSWWSRRSTPSAPRMPGTGSGFGSGFGIPGLEGSWLPVVILAAVLLGALLVWRFWYLRAPQADSLLGPGGLGAWPVDPRRIASREELVKAFEYLSVLICGASARMWTHHTIAEALADLARTQLDTALMLARLYELARYAPLDEPLTTGEIAEARRIVCRLAGMSDE